MASGLERLEPILYAEVVRGALAEDLGRGGDLTTRAIVPPDVLGRARIVSRQEGRLAGVDVAIAVFRQMDARVAVVSKLPDGSDVVADDELIVIEGAAAALLTGERTALNLMGHLSGVATATRAMVATVAGCSAEIVCTRKTTPGLRALEKYAVRVGGGRNHRFGLDDAVLIKDNHLEIAGGVPQALGRARAAVGHMTRVEVEVENLDQLDEALESGADAILLDNMTLDELRAAVSRAKGRATLEASGGVDETSARGVAETGVDLISCGAITHSAQALDLSMALELIAA